MAKKRYHNHEPGHKCFTCSLGELNDKVQILLLEEIEKVSNQCSARRSLSGSPGRRKSRSLSRNELNKPKIVFG
jgi:hypothetical protein